MEKFITLILVGIIIVTLGITNIKGNISSIHWYNRRKVSANDISSYGKCMGTGSVIIGGSMIIAAILEMIFKSDIFDYITLFGCLVGFIVMLYGQFKYNKGIF